MRHPPGNSPRPEFKALARNASLSLVVLALLAAPARAAAPDPALPCPAEGTVIQADGEAHTTVANDLLTIALTFEKEGPLLPELHAEMQKEAAVALSKAKETPEVEVKTAGYGIYPVYEKGRLVRQRASYRLSLETRDFAAGLALAAALQPFRISNLLFSVSPVRRQATEKTLLEEAIADLRDNVGIAAHALGTKTMTITNLSIGSRQYQPVPQRLPQEAVMEMAAAAAPVVAEAGESQVSITVSGTALVK